METLRHIAAVTAHTAGDDHTVHLPKQRERVGGHRQRWMESLSLARRNGTPAFFLFFPDYGISGSPRTRIRPGSMTTTLPSVRSRSIVARLASNASARTGESALSIRNLTRRR